MSAPATLNASLFHPRFWGTWFVFALLWLVVTVLPFRVQILLGKGLGHLLRLVLKKRVKVARRNLELCYPEITKPEREKMLRRNFENSGIALFELGMGWFWPRWRLARRFEVLGLDKVKEIVQQGQGVVAINMHFLTLEISARVQGHELPGCGFYRANKNPLIDFLQCYGRSRDGNELIDKNDIKGAIKALRKGKVLWYAPDQDYGRRRSIFVPFFGIPDAATVPATSSLTRLGKAKAVLVTVVRKADNSGYRVVYHPPLQAFPSKDESADTIRINQLMEKEIRKFPEQYMWLHRRFKTRPEEGMPSYYA